MTAYDVIGQKISSLGADASISPSIMPEFYHTPVRRPGIYNSGVLRFTFYVCREELKMMLLFCLFVFLYYIFFFLLSLSTG